MELLVDTSSSSRELQGDDLQRWAEDHTAFISSEMQQLAAERRAVADSLRALGMRVVMFEDLGGRDETAERAYLDGVARSDVYIGIVGERYGTMLASGRSPTHEEYREAVRRGKRISVWVCRDGSQRQGSARDFVQEVRAFHTTGTFTDADDLAGRVGKRVGEIAAHEESPWVKVSEAVFRADSIRATGDRIRIETAVRDKRVARHLEGLRPGRELVKITTQDRSGDATIEDVVSHVTVRSLQRMTITASVTWSDRYIVLPRYAQVGYSAGDIQELELRAGLFGEPVPGELTALPIDPLSPLRSQELAEGDVEPIARLLLVEELLGQSQQMESVDSFEIGPELHGERRIRLVYTEPAIAPIPGFIEPAQARPARQREIQGSWGGPASL